MNLSELPELREYRNALAKGHGGGTGAALRAANTAAKSVYDKAISGTGKPRSQLTDRAIREAVASTVAGVRRGTVTITGRGRPAVAETAPRPAKKGGKRKAREARIREAVQRAISNMTAEAASPPRAPAAAPSVPLTEMSTDELAGQLVAHSAAARAALVTESGTEQYAAEPASLPDMPLPELSYEDFEQFFRDAMVAHAEAELASPFARGAGAPRSPFWRGLQ